MSKSAIYVANTGAQAVAVGGTIGLGGVIRRFGCAVELSGNSVVINEAGYYGVNVSITAEPTAAGTITATLFNNGVEVPGATASATAAAAGNPVNLSFESLVRVFCGATSGTLTLILTGGAANVTNSAMVVEKL
jgi:hypothetical protein